MCTKVQIHLPYIYTYLPKYKLTYKIKLYRKQWLECTILQDKLVNTLHTTTQ